MRSWLWSMALAALAGILLAGCGNPKINAKDAETYQTSLETMRASLSASKRARLDAAVTAIFAAAREREKRLGGSGMGEFGIMLSLDEKTADQIIAMAEAAEHGSAQ